MHEVLSGLNALIDGLVYISMLYFNLCCYLGVKFVAFCGKMQQFVAVGQIRKFCKSPDGREKFTTLAIINNTQPSI